MDGTFQENVLQLWRFSNPINSKYCVYFIDSLLFYKMTILMIKHLWLLNKRLKFQLSGVKPIQYVEKTKLYVVINTGSSIVHSVRIKQVRLQQGFTVNKTSQWNSSEKFQPSIFIERWRLLILLSCSLSCPSLFWYYLHLLKFSLFLKIKFGLRNHWQTEYFFIHLMFT